MRMQVFQLLGIFLTQNGHGIEFFPKSIYFIRLSNLMFQPKQSAEFITWVIKYLDEVSDKAKRIGAVNTIVNDNGSLTGYNTDYESMSWSFKKLKIDNDEFLKKQNIDLSLRPEKLSENLFYKITEYYEKNKAK